MRGGILCDRIIVRLRSKDVEVRGQLWVKMKAPSCNSGDATEHDSTVSARLNDSLKRMIESRDKKAQVVKVLDAVRGRAKLDEEQPRMKVLELREKMKQLDSQRCDLHKRIPKASNDGLTRSDGGGACSMVEDSGAEDTDAFLDGSESSGRSTFSK
ncbi:hypothetical protein FDECE_6945 [Fusarium decemcellulare]|nr:hypothetical protein FDECE_6945 [Fusarium decemcellulare]